MPLPLCVLTTLKLYYLLTSLILVSSFRCAAMSPITHRIWQQVITVIAFELMSRVFTQIMWGRAELTRQIKGRHSHLNMLSQVSRILSNRILGDDGTTIESSSQAPAACSASVCEIKLVRNVGVNLFRLDQIVTALLKYRLKKKFVSITVLFPHEKRSLLLKYSINFKLFDFPAFLQRF